jgi:antitoxin component YwqK of YwqJK toxin-antitoxin module
MKTLLYISAICFSISALGQKDSLNRVDAEGKKQGHWKNHESVEGTSVLTSEGSYLDNERTGIWTQYYSNGTVKSRKHFVNGYVNGSVIEYFPDGTMKEKGSWMDKKWIGAYELYYSSGNICQKLFFNDEGKKDGKQVYFFEDGSASSLEYYSNKVQDSSVSYYPGGAIKEKYIKDKYKVDFRKDGRKRSESIYSGNTKIYRAYYDNGNLSEEVSYKNGKMDGDCILYYKNGTIKYGCIYKEGKMSGIRLGMTEDGKLINGFYTTYHENGIVERAGKYINGKPDGEHRLYGRDGKLAMSVSYKNGRPDGELKHYDNSGKAYSTEVYKNGFFLSEK